MSRKNKKGKQRRDDYYHKAKIAGFRARSAYKLIQLNKKYEFLQKSQVCIDLCAAPGSWMQVAKKYMPLSSVIVGVDLYPINPIPGALSIVGDITTEKLRQDLRGTLKTWKADLVLHDGAPNVGQNWLHDAYQQNLLTLHAFKLACEFLKKGGYFVTKVFRSKDYFKLEYVLRKLFKKVEATKPQASRYESAEIFVVCSGYIDPSKIDDQFFSAKHVFEELDLEPSNDKLNILKPVKTKKQKPEGYAEGATTLYNRVPVSKFIESSEFIQVLQEASEFVFDDEAVKNHKLTTPAIVENCKDIKVLGRKDLRLLLTWRKNIQEDLQKKKENEEKVLALAKIAEDDEKDEDEDEDEEEDEELKKLDQQILEMKMEQAKEAKRKRKLILKGKKKLEQQMRLKSLIPGDPGPTESTNHGLFNLKRLSQVESMDGVLEQSTHAVFDSDSEEEEEDEPLPKYKRYVKDETVLHESGRYYMDKSEIGKEEKKKETADIDESAEMDGRLALQNVDDLSFQPIDTDYDADNDDNNALLTDLVGDHREAKRVRKAEIFFNQDLFEGLETEAVEDYELEKAIKTFKEGGGMMLQKEKTKDKNRDKRKEQNEETEASGELGKAVQTNKETDGNMETKERKKKKKTKKKEEKENEENAEVARDAPDEDEDDALSYSESEEDSENEDVPFGPKMITKAVVSGGGPKDKKNGTARGLDPVGLALASKMIHSKKEKREIIDKAWNRYMYGDEDDLPPWFAAYERKFNTPIIEVEREDLRMYRDRGKDVNARTIKKVVEAKARKQRRVKKQTGKARKKAEVVLNNPDMSEKEKSREIKKLYSRAMKPLQKKEKTYVVMKKKDAGKKPRGVKGPYKMVDKRMKKDLQAQKKADAKKGGRKNSRPNTNKRQRKGKNKRA